MTPSTQPFLTRPTLRRWVAASCLIVGTLLSSCGGQSSGTGNTAGGTNPSIPGGGGTSSLATTGAFKAQVVTGNPLPSEFISFLTKEGNWYAVYYLRNGQENVYPDIYTGIVTPTSSSSATVAFLASQGVSTKVSTGSAIISGGSSSNFHLELSGLTMPISNASAIDPKSLTTLTEIGGEWDGALKDGRSTAEPSLKLTFSSTGELVSDSWYANCHLVLTLSLKSASNNPYYAAELTLDKDATQCARIHQNTGHAVHMTGIGLIHASPLSGKTKRLELILTDTNGSGISFRGDQ